MISAAINHIALHLNQYLRQAHQLGDDIVVVSNLLSQDGALARDTANKVIVCLVNIEKDTLPQQAPPAASGNGRVGVYGRPLFLNLEIVVAANFGDKNYSEALAFISSAIGFFHHTPVFDHQLTPDLDDRIEKLLLDMENLTHHELSNLWTMLSGRYLPSVLYKMRMISYGDGALIGQAPVVSRPHTSVGA
ncbi:hypothetical protein JOD97_000735 [Duganella sp. 1411]|uniref:DUF4255 domain-containing protein n=1 Tax=Duganella sp. 1411 TaxID=2806572 RepID=UPI001AEA3F8B|nr:hypothetical protein [Duganella sp. 1411]